MPADPHGSAPRRPWSARRRARFVRTVTLTAVLVALAVLGWVVPRISDARQHDDRAAPATRSSRPAPAANGSTPSPSATLDDDHDGTRGVYGDVSPDVPAHGHDTFTAYPAASGPATLPGRAVRYSIEVEDGLGLDADNFRETVQQTLLDPGRGWQVQDHVRWVGVSPDDVRAGKPVDIRVILASPGTVDKYCAPLRTNGAVSCYNNGRAMLNAQRWVTGAYTYGEDLKDYRTYQINHEVGHGLGHGHVACPGAGAHAPVMLQQTKTLQSCRPWPYPVGS